MKGYQRRMPSFPDLPERMITGSLEPVQEFEPDEKLYRRCSNDMVIGGHLAPPSVTTQPQGIDFPEMSVNRGNFSEANDVCLAISRTDSDWDRWGIAQFIVSDVPEQYNGTLIPQQPEWTWRLFHNPDPENYAHSEVRSYGDGNFATPPKLVRKWFRTALHFKAKVIKDPQK